MASPACSMHPYVANWQEGESRCTIEAGKALGLSTAKAYALLCQWESEGLVCRYGYRVAPGVWDPPESNQLRRRSLYWQRI